MLEYPEGNPRSKTKANNKVNPLWHKAAMEPELHEWKASALTTRHPLLKDVVRKSPVTTICRSSGILSYILYYFLSFPFLFSFRNPLIYM